MSTTAARKLTTSAMIASFADPGQRTSPAPFGHALARLADERPEVVGLSADLAKYTDMHVFRERHPQRFFQMGMAEQLMLGAAAGMAEVGLVPFASTYSVFATRRAYDFLCLDIAEPGLNVNVVGAGGARARGRPRTDVPAPPARPRADGPRRVRLPLPGREGGAAAHRPRRPAHLDRPHDHARARRREARRRRSRRRRRPARPHAQAARPRGDPARERVRPPRRDAREPHDRRRARESVASCLAFAGQGRRIVPVALPDEFLAAGALPTLHDRYGLSTDAVVAKIKAELDG